VLTSFTVNNEVPLHFPGDVCCNCGESGSVEQLETNLRLMPLGGLAGAQITVPVPLPYCNKCKATARRGRPNVFGIVAMIALLALTMITAWFLAAGELVDKLPLELAAAAATLLSIALVVAFYATRRPKQPQTSYYQPVRLVKLSQKWPADISAMVLYFSHQSFARKFEAANQDAIAKGILKVVSP
jgi:hypothetical protein